MIYHHPRTMIPPRIAIIDDDTELREMLADILREEGFAAQTFTDDNCVKDLEKLNPDIIVVDYWLAPSHTSEGLIEKVKTNKQLKSTPIVLMSNDRSVAKKKKETAVDVFLSKPFAIETLVSTLRTFVK